MTANELADELENTYPFVGVMEVSAIMLRQQAQEIEDLKNANRFIQNFAEEQHQRAVALEMRELTDEEIESAWFKVFKPEPGIGKNITNGVYEFARLILKKAGEK